MRARPLLIIEGQSPIHLFQHFYYKIYIIIAKTKMVFTNFVSFKL